MMSLLRIIFGVLVGIGFFVALAFLSDHFPRATGRFAFTIIGCGLGVLGIWSVRRSLRIGVAGTFGAGSYNRDINPFGFWLFILIFSLFTLFGFAIAICSVLAPKLVGLR